MRIKWYWPLILAFALCSGGCGGFVARRMAQAPNTYPTWFAPKARVMLAFNSHFLTNFPAQFLEAGPPSARLLYRVVEPADYQFKIATTNWQERGKEQFQFNIRAVVPGQSNSWTAAPRGTVILLHGYGVAQFAMLPWALRLAEDGWRCVLVDLRGHGKSTGKRIYFGTRETQDLTELLDQLARDGKLSGPVDVLGESYGAALALRWKTVDPRVQSIVAIAPYAELSDAVINISKDYAPWMPKWLLRSGLAKLPSLLKIEAAQLDTTTVLSRNHVAALFIAGAEDKVTPVSEVQHLNELAAPGSRLIIVPRATHEAVTYFFKDLVPDVLSWLDATHPPVNAGS
jgi:pimeloyl-ACP methyl ester carboxylesterase